MLPEAERFELAHALVNAPDDANALDGGLG